MGIGYYILGENRGRLPDIPNQTNYREANMKMSAENFAHLKNAINTTIEKAGGVDVVVSRYETGDFARSDKVKDLQMRFCFDLLHCSVGNGWVCDVLYKENELNDNHIYTALKQIAPKVVKRY